MAATATVNGDYTVTLTTDDTGAGTWYRAYSGNPDLPVGSTHTTVDRWVPLGVPVTWYWAGAGGVQQTEPVTVDDSRGPVLSSATGSGMLHVVVVSQPPLRWEARSVAHDILYRADPVVTVAPARYHSATLRLYLPDPLQRANVRTLLARGEPLILRTTCRDAVDDVTFLPTRWTEELVSASRKAGPRWLDVEYQAVMDNPSGYAPLPAWSWTALEAAVAEWDAVPETWATWADVEQGLP
jgi:hypothetical protein